MDLASNSARHRVDKLAELRALHEPRPADSSARESPRRSPRERPLVKPRPRECGARGGLTAPRSAPYMSPWEPGRRPPALPARETVGIRGVTLPTNPRDGPHQCSPVPERPRRRDGIVDDKAHIRWFAQQRRVPTGEYKACKEQFCSEAQEGSLADRGHGWLRLTRELRRARFIAGDHATAAIAGAMEGTLSTRV